MEERVTKLSYGFDDLMGKGKKVGAQVPSE